MSLSSGSSSDSSGESLCADLSRLALSERTLKSSTTKAPSWGSCKTPESVYSGVQRGISKFSLASENKKQSSFSHSGSKISPNPGPSGVSSPADSGLSEENKERIRFAQVRRKKDFVHIEKIDGKRINILQGLELHTRVFNMEEQKEIVKCVYDLQHKGQRGLLRKRTYSEPRKWMRGKGRVTIQFGCCYNYAMDKDGNLPGIVRDEEVDPLPPVFKKMIKRMVRWHVLPATCIPNSCIVNIYDEGDCIPPHIDHHDFLRPFCTVSFLTECNILFGTSLKVVSPGEFAGSVSIPLPIGSVLILNGNGADAAKHCVPAVPSKRISITFRKMAERKLPYSYLPDQELLEVKPLDNTSLTKSPREGSYDQNKVVTPGKATVVAERSDKTFVIEKDEFPPLGSLK